MASNEDFNKTTDFLNSSIDSLIGPIYSLIKSLWLDCPFFFFLLMGSSSEEDEEESSDLKLTAGILFFFFFFEVMSISGFDSEDESDELKNRSVPSSYASPVRIYLCP